jgi:hypothetical protein
VFCFDFNFIALQKLFIPIFAFRCSYVTQTITHFYKPVRQFHYSEFLLNMNSTTKARKFILKTSLTNLTACISLSNCTPPIFDPPQSGAGVPHLLTLYRATVGCTEHTCLASPYLVDISCFLLNLTSFQYSMTYQSSSHGSHGENR